ncbi:hypothetical protein [Thauera sinica]|uniref:Uncharacterized protein n=1 Tax=Thauera sinica TaxID=2665146 RepID=A0ABW1ARH8_9RHOO|nr:hypothetical protein [Thauera sp. K11]
MVTGVTGGVGVLLAVQAKTALGTTVCQSPSAMVSGNASPSPNQAPCSGGRSPGFWKVPQHFGHWPIAGAQYPTFSDNIGVCGSSGMKGLNKYSDVVSKILTPGTLIQTLFPGAPVPAGAGIWAVLAFPEDSAFNSTGYGQFMRHLASAWLNAGYFADYPISRQRITEMWNAIYPSNGVYYPSGNNSGGMDKNQLIAYISGMYDINADNLEEPLCSTTSSSSTTTTTTSTTTTTQ